MATNGPAPGTVDVPTFHTIGVGAGPANLSLAALFGAAGPQRVGLFERQPFASWHRGLLYSGVRMQTSWIKDLVSLVDPTHPMSFLSYLVSSGRAFAFLNAQHDSIPRLEFVRYLAWASDQIGDVHYGTAIDEINFDDGFEVRSQGRTVARSDNLVLGLGTEPFIPPGLSGVAEDRRIVADDLIDWLEGTETEPAGTDRHEPIAVVGGGQTGAECVMELLNHGYDDVRWFGRRPWFAPLDDSPSANEFYRPAYAQFFQQLPRQVRRDLVDSQVLTSDGVSAATLRTLYQHNYEQLLRTGRFPLTMLPGRDVTGMEPDAGGGVRLACQTATGTETHEVRRIVCATGRRPSALPFGPELAERVELDETGDLIVEDDFSVRWKGSNGHRIYAQNRARYTHGLTDANLSLLPMRSAVIINSLFEREIFDIRDENLSTAWG
ncbi:MAG TPA: SidA/IucD/PvdA family monooxygenase [Mycobacteriales bacterium]|nr:SidA/IucD/PvdA family monooxygenase [Mycobacteriales bacterium]